MSVIQVIQERMPLALSARISTPSGRQYRWAADDPNSENVLSDPTLSDTMPGGFENGSGSLVRDPAYDYADLEELSTIRWEGVGELCAWEGRLESSPRTSGDKMVISPGAVGWQAALDDEPAPFIYLDQDKTQWKGAPSSVKESEINNSGVTALSDPSTKWNTDTGVSELVQELQGASSGILESMAFYESPTPLQSLYYAWRKSAIIDHTNTNWEWQAVLIDNPPNWTADGTGNLRSAGPGLGDIWATVSDRKWAALSFWFGTGEPFDATFDIFWTYLALQSWGAPDAVGTLAADGGIGMMASDVVAHAVSTWAPILSMARGALSTIEPSNFPIPQLAFRDSTNTVSAIVKECSKYELHDWWVDEGPTFNFSLPGNHGRRWRARVGPSKLEDTGPQIDRLYNEVVVTYRDVDGSTRSVGPPGSGADFEDWGLADTSFTNPLNELGITHRAVVSMGTSTSDGATQVGYTFLTQNNLRSTAGKATLDGWVQSADTGIWWPAWYVRSGDQVMFSDAHDTSFRRIVKKSYQNRSIAVDLDQPPNGLQELLERMALDIVRSGVS